MGVGFGDALIADGQVRFVGQRAAGADALHHGGGHHEGFAGRGEAELAAVGGFEVLGDLVPFPEIHLQGGVSTIVFDAQAVSVANVLRRAALLR